MTARLPAGTAGPRPRGRFTDLTLIGSGASCPVTAVLSLLCPLIVRRPEASVPHSYDRPPDRDRSRNMDANEVPCN